MTVYRGPTQQEASQRTISSWVRKPGEIELSPCIARIPRAVMLFRCLWPGLELQLYYLFLDCYEQGQAIRTVWFKIHSLAIFRELFANISSNTVFRFSNKQFCGFIGQYQMSLRFITQKSSGVPEDGRRVRLNWL